MEVFLRAKKKQVPGDRFLHVRGGVSKKTIRKIYKQKFSPRSWRCFLITIFTFFSRSVFSTFVEVFLKLRLLLVLMVRFLYVRGGVSPLVWAEEYECKFSLHPWRCFWTNGQSQATV